LWQCIRSSASRWWIWRRSRTLHINGVRLKCDSIRMNSLNRGLTAEISVISAAQAVKCCCFKTHE
jgi:hypothetical protein